MNIILAMEKSNIVLFPFWANILGEYIIQFVQDSAGLCLDGAGLRPGIIIHGSHFPYQKFLVWTIIVFHILLSSCFLCP